MLDTTALLDFLAVVDAELERPIALVAVGGTALTLLGVKPSTRDVDFTAPAQDAALFDAAQRRIPHGFRIDLWTEGAVFSQFLPADYLARSSAVRTRLRRIDLRALHPVDIVVTKIGRLDERDKQDIAACVQRFRLTRQEVRARARQVQYVGNEEVFQSNLAHALRTLFPPRAPG